MDTTKVTFIWHFGFILFFGEELCHCNYGLSENSEWRCLNHSRDKTGESHWTPFECTCLHSGESESPTSSTLIDLDGVSWCDEVSWFVIE